MANKFDLRLPQASSKQQAVIPAHKRWVRLERWTVDYADTTGINLTVPEQYIGASIAIGLYYTVRRWHHPIHAFNRARGFKLHHKADADMWVEGLRAVLHDPSRWKPRALPFAVTADAIAREVRELADAIACATLPTGHRMTR